MNPQLFELLKIVVQGCVLFVTGTGVAFVTTRFVEAYKRNEALTLELGRARAQALVRTISTVSEFYVLQKRLFELAKSGEWDRSKPEAENPHSVQVIHEQLKQNLKLITEHAIRDSALLQPDQVAAIQEIGNLVRDFPFKIGEARIPHEVEVDAHLQKIKEARRKLTRYIPDLKPLRPLPKKR